MQKFLFTDFTTASGSRRASAWRGVATTPGEESDIAAIWAKVCGYADA
jgi:hypothetical protein